MKVPIIAFLVSFIFAASAPKTITFQKRINQDLKILSLRKSSFVTNQKKSKKHQTVSQEIKKYFYLSSNLLEKADYRNYHQQGFNIHEWQCLVNGEEQTIQQIEYTSTTPPTYTFYAIYHPSSITGETLYISEQNLGLISYQINDEITSVRHTRIEQAPALIKKAQNFASQVKKMAILD